MTIGRPPTGTAGFARTHVSGSSRVPNPAASTSAGGSEADPVIDAPHDHSTPRGRARRAIGAGQSMSMSPTGMPCDSQCCSQRLRYDKAM